MIISHSLQEVTHRNNFIATVGTFDGVHLGHQSIIKQVTDHARESSDRSLVITFEPHPREVLGKGPVKLLTKLDERLDLLNHLGVDDVLVLNFTYEFSRQSSREFYEKYIFRNISVKEVVVGYDHMFGRDREGGIGELKQLGIELGFKVFVVDPIFRNGRVISSSKIRDSLSTGDIDQANKFLGYSYFLEGRVVEGNHRGSPLGFPTANLYIIDGQKLIPANGVYFVSLQIEGRPYYGMLNIGTRPTFEIGLNRVVEVHIFNVKENLYGKTLRIQFEKHLRPEKKFSSKEELIMQLQHDRDECMNYIPTLQQSQIG